MTFETLIAELPTRQQNGTVQEPVVLNLRRELRRSRVTIRELAAELGVTLKRVREVRDSEAIPYLIAVDHLDAIRRVHAGRTDAVAA